MNSNSIIRIFATFALLVVAMFVAFDVFTSGTNAVARLYMYALLGGAALGMLNPQRAFTVLVFLTAYLDYFKRFMIFDSGVSKMDLYYVLGIAPATLAGISANIVYRHISGKLDARPGMGRLILVTNCATIGLGLVSLLGSSSGFRDVGDTVNATIYIQLLFVVPALFRTPEQVRTLLKTLLICYIPSVLYYLLHAYRQTFMNVRMGVFDYEMRYLLSGMTIEIRQLMERVPRPFGTMSSASNVSMVYAWLFIVLTSGFWVMPSLEGRGRSGTFWRWVLALLIGVAMYASFSRTGWVFAVVGVAAAVMIRNRLMTSLGYSVAFLSVILAFVSAGYLLKHQILNEISMDLYKSKRTGEWSQTTNLATLNDRLEGFAALMETGEAWTPFGLRFTSREIYIRSKVNTHDVITSTLMSYGYVPIIISLVLAFRFLGKLHNLVYELPKNHVKIMAATLLAGGLSLISGAVVNGAQFLTYPINFFIWFSFACATALRIWVLEQRALEARERALAEGDSGRLPGIGSMRPGMLRPSLGPMPARARAQG